MLEEKYPYFDTLVIESADVSSKLQAEIVDVLNEVLKGLEDWAIALIVIACLAVVAVILIAVLCCCGCCTACMCCVSCFKKCLCCCCD